MRKITFSRNIVVLFFLNYHVSHYNVLDWGVFRKTPVAENEASAPGGDETKQADS